MNYNPLPAIPRITHAPKKSNHPVGRTVGMERLFCLLVSDFLLLSQLFVIPCAFIIILDAVDKLLCINTIISLENFIVTRALNIISDAIDIISRMHTVI